MFIGQIGSTAILAAGDSADSSGFSAGSLLIPAAGVALLIVGLVLRNRSKAAPAAAADSDKIPTEAPTSGLPKHTGTIVAVAGVLVLALGLVAGLTKSGTISTKDPELAVGNCVSATDYRGAQVGKIKPTACDDTAAVYELAAAPKNGATCPDGKLRDANYFVLTNGNSSLCFAPNVKVGNCYAMQPGVNQIAPADCATKSTATAVVAQIAARFEGSTDANQCAMPDGAVVTPQPARVVCWQPVAAPAG